MVTTRITEATPITIPRAVSPDRTGLARNACALNFSASPRNMRSASRLLQQLFRVGARRVVGGERSGQILPQQLPGGLQVAVVLDVRFGFGEHELGAVGRDFVCVQEGLVADKIAPHS